jgi:hypothetical protein
MINKKRDDQIMFFFYPTEMDVPTGTEGGM